MNYYTDKVICSVSPYGSSLSAKITLNFDEPFQPKNDMLYVHRNGHVTKAAHVDYTDSRPAGVISVSTWDSQQYRLYGYGLQYRTSITISVVNKNDGKRTPFHSVELTDRIKDLKARICRTLNEPQRQMSLHSNGISLREEQTVEECGIKDGHVLEIRPRNLRAGLEDSSCIAF